MFTNAEDVLDLADRQRAGLDEWEPAVGVDRRNVADGAASFHLFNEILHRLTTVIDVPDITQQLDAIQRHEQQSTEPDDDQRRDKSYQQQRDENDQQKPDVDVRANTPPYPAGYDREASRETGLLDVAGIRSAIVGIAALSQLQSRDRHKVEYGYDGWWR